MECNGICQDTAGIYFKTVCAGSYEGLPHKIMLRNNYPNKLYKNICREHQNFAKIAYNYDPGILEVNNGKLVEIPIDIRYDRLQEFLDHLNVD